MEHLCLPRDVVAPGPGSVPYVCKKDYDGGPFLTYPARREDLNPVRPVVLSEFSHLNPLNAMPVAELEAFIQTWLFFGLLTEIFGDLFVPSQYISTHVALNEASITGLSPSFNIPGSTKILNTSQLIPMVSAWMSRIQASNEPEEDRRSQYEHIAACLRMTLTLRAVQPSMRPDFNPWIRRCIASIGELLAQAANQAYCIDYGTANECPSNWQILYKDDAIMAQMKASGYCPYEIHRIRSLFMTIETSHFLTWMRRDIGSTRHQNCTEEVCRAHFNSLGQYIAKHRPETRRCENPAIDVSKVIRILTRGSLPLLRIIPASTHERLRVHVVEARPELKYIALSHVWADGLGNPHANSLPECQLQHLFELSRPFSSMEREEMLFWIDTLCCPVEPPEAKMMAMNQMKVPYTNASHVLVLDSSLQEIDSSDLYPTEIGLRIFTTGWMRRLWTLQEGALAGKLWFQFKTTVIELQQLWADIIDVFNNDIQRKGLALDISAQYLALRRFFHPERGDDNVDLISVDQALQFRSVTVASDEPLLIGSLLNLDISHILNGGDGSEDSRMQRLWPLIASAFGGIPKSILFCRGSRLTQSGFKWAPASILNSKGGRDGKFERSTSEYDAGHLTPDGLRVRLAAFTIRMASAPKGLPKNPWNMFGHKDENSIKCRNENGVWFRIQGKYGSREADGRLRRPSLQHILKSESRPQTLLLASSFKLDGTPETMNGLLVHHGNHKDGIPRVISDMIVEGGITRGTSEILFEAAYQASRRLLDDEIIDQYVDLGIEDENEQREHPSYLDLNAALEKKLYALMESIDDQRFHEVIQAYNSRGSRGLFPALIASFGLGDYCDLGPMMPEDTAWVVD